MPSWLEINAGEELNGRAPCAVTGFARIGTLCLHSLTRHSGAHGIRRAGVWVMAATSIHSRRLGITIGDRYGQRLKVLLDEREASHPEDVIVIDEPISVKYGVAALQHKLEKGLFPVMSQKPDQRGRQEQPFSARL